MATRTPDYDFLAMNKDTDERNRVGAGWINPDGSISIVLSPFIQLSASKSLVLNLFTKKAKE